RGSMSISRGTLQSPDNFHHTRANRSEGRDSAAIMKAPKLTPLLTVAFLLLVPLFLRAQDPQPESSSKSADAPAPAPPKSSSKKNKDTATKSATDQPTWDPLRAEKDLEVGQYYMKKGDIDAAIDRFQDATL